MTKLIAHRGLLNGPDKEKENRPDQISKALKEGYGCEIDLWCINSELWLGHDEPQYPIRDTFLSQLDLWIHAKNLAALRWLTNTDLNYFWHQDDTFTLTSHKFIWTYPGKELTTRSVMVLPELTDPKFQNLNFNCYGICSDYVSEIKELLSK